MIRTPRGHHSVSAIRVSALSGLSGTSLKCQPSSRPVNRRGNGLVSLLGAPTGRGVEKADISDCQNIFFIVIRTKVDIFTRKLCLISELVVTVASLS